MAYSQRRKQRVATPSQNAGEKSVMKIISQFLALHKIPHWRINSGGLKDRNNRLVRFGAKGMSDYYAIGSSGVSIWIECKRPKGGRLSEAQRNFLDCINRNGGIGIVVNSVESLEQQLKEAGVI